MSKNIVPTDASQYNLTSFADLLPAREHIVGEDPGSFDGFREGMMRTLAAMTPYECVVAENLIAIEWEFLQQHRMRNTGLRKIIREAICDAVMARAKAQHEEALDEAWEAHVDAGGGEADWKSPFSFDKEAAMDAGLKLAEKAVSRDLNDVAAAAAEIESMGLALVEVMGEAYRSSGAEVVFHDNKVQQLERRRRDVKRDFDALQKTRPVDAEVIEG